MMISAFLDYLKRVKEAEIAARVAHDRCKQAMLDAKDNLIWNLAIEAAAKVADEYDPDDKIIADDIRKLKR